MNSMLRTRCAIDRKELEVVRHFDEGKVLDGLAW